MTCRLLSVITFFALLIGALQAAEPELLLYSNFDGEAEATTARGDATATFTHEPIFRPGISGQAVLIGGELTREQKLTNGLPEMEVPGRNVSYSPEGNLNLDQGTISFWVKPLDWTGTTKGFNVLFHTRVGKDYFQLYKFWSNDELRFIIGEAGTYTKAHLQAGVWEPGAWYHLAFTWSDSEVRMFEDGRLIFVTRRRFPLSSSGPIKPVTVGPGGNWVKGYNGQSLIDEFRIHDQPLSQAQIAALYNEHADQVKRPAGKLTVGQQTPRLDGAIKNDDYSFRATGFSTGTNGRLAIRQAYYALSYDDEQLYLGVDMPESAEGATLYLKPSLDGPLQQVQVLPGGTIANAEGQPIEAAEAIENVMEGRRVIEAAIPYAAVGMDGPPDHQDWRFNLTIQLTEPEQVIAAAPSLGDPTLNPNMMELAFRPDAPTISLSELYDLTTLTNRIDLVVKSDNPTDSLQYVNITDTTMKYGLRTFSRTLFEDGAPTPLRAPQPPRELWSIPAFAIVKHRVVREQEKGEEPLFSIKLIHEDPAPLQIEYLYTLGRQELLVAGRRRGTGQMQVRFLRQDGELTWSTSKALPENADYFKLTFDLQFDQLPPDTYELAIDHLAADGTATEVWRQAYQIPSISSPILQPYVDPEDQVVPAPWTPVEVTDTTVSTWGRSYDFGGDLLVRSLRSKDQELLAAEPHLRLDGQPLQAVNPSHTVHLGSNHMEARFSKTADLGQLNVKTDVTTAFDGFSQIEMVIAPQQPGQTVQSLSLDFPMHSEMVQLVCDNEISELVGGKTGAVGDYWHQELIDDPFIWIGNDEVGFNWLARTLRTWKMQDVSKNIEIIREGDIATIRFNLIDHEVTLDEPLTISFGFILTPSRPLRTDLMRQRPGKEWEKWIQPWKYFGVPDYDTADRGQIAYRSSRFDESFLYMGEYAAPYSPEYPFWEQEWRMLLPKGNHNYGEVYSSGLYSDRRLREKFTYSVSCIHSETLRNYILNKRATFYEQAKTPLDPKAINYYFDTGIGSAPCRNHHHGCVPWIGPDGNEHGELPIEEYRKIVLDTYRMIRRTGPNAKIMSHYGWVRAMPMQHFTDIMLGGEGVENQVATQGNYFDLLNPEKFRAVYSPYIYGVKMVFLNMLARAAMTSPEAILAFAKDPDSQQATRHVYGYTLVHDVDNWDSHDATKDVREKVYDAQDQLGWNEQVRFFPYWVDNPAVAIESAANPDRLLASAYTNGDRLMLVVLNDTDEAMEATLRLDLEQLGVADGLTGSDSFDTSRTYTLSDQWQDSVPPRDLRLILFEPAD